MNDGYRLSPNFCRSDFGVFISSKADSAGSDALRKISDLTIWAFSHPNVWAASSAVRVESGNS